MNVIKNYLNELNTLQELNLKKESLTGEELARVEREIESVLLRAQRFANLAKYQGNLLKKAMPRNNGVPRWSKLNF